MKKMVVSLVILMLGLVGVVSAFQQISLNPQTIGIPPGGTDTVIATVLDGGVPVGNTTITIFQKCEELGGNANICDNGDDFATTEITVTVTSPTDVNGQATVTIQVANNANGKYHYLVKTPDSLGVWGAASTGTVLIPEFTTIGAALVLLGAGWYVIRKRKK